MFGRLVFANKELPTSTSVRKQIAAGGKRSMLESFKSGRVNAKNHRSAATETAVFILNKLMDKLTCAND